MQERKPEGLSVPPDMAFVLVPAGRRQVLVEININKAALHIEILLILGIRAKHILYSDKTR